MEIIIVSLPRYFHPVCSLFHKAGHNVYYLKLSLPPGISPEAESHIVEKLLQRGISPLPLADIPHYDGISDIEIDPEMKAYQRTREIAPQCLLEGLKGLFPNIPHIEKKLELAVHSTVNLQQMYITAKVNIWARANLKKRILLIDFDIKSLVNPKMEQNVRQIIIPLSFFENGWRNISTLCYSALRKCQAIINRKASSQENNQGSKGQEQKTGSRPRVAYVTHQGLKFGSLFQKDLFYSDNKESELYPEHLLHIDYSGIPSPSKKNLWVCLGSQKQSYLFHLYNAFVALGKGIIHVHRICHIFGLFILIRFYVNFCSYSKKLEAYPELQIALIDYDVLCPKDLILALESKGIRTIATQERFVSAFVKLFTSVILNDYLCNSPYTAKAMMRTPINCVDNYIPVGQYRTDTLLKAQKAPPPEILKPKIIKGYKIITALGYHTHMKWHESQVDLIQNWKTHKKFLLDMIQLSRDIPSIFIVLRYKTVDWMTLPEFSNTIQEIRSSDNIMISTDYSKDYFSYDICAHSDLVIAKYTSLADECLSVGIPVLFHEYTHNTERILADVFDYNPAKIMCFNYQELLERAKIVINGKPNTIIQDYEYLKNIVYGGLSDGRVKERIHKHIEELLSKL